MRGDTSLELTIIKSIHPEVEGEAAIEEYYELCKSYDHHTFRCRNLGAKLAAKFLAGEIGGCLTIEDLEVEKAKDEQTIKGQIWASLGKNGHKWASLGKIGRAAGEVCPTGRRPTVDRTKDAWLG
ncbi:hypothetical protein; 35812-36376 [Arabidopsis thaliana]|uniref:Uncharacterized protein T4I21.8 n=1 Tax=Arabidopsis thaliana TaxID=3702 RepID=Q9C8Q8_ARATH|nr:hypothetical protein; 35812-36376 [Arabidopsis thaliana]